jgi:hypothetical protein
MLLIYRIRGLQSKPISLLGLSAVRILSQRDKNHISRCWKIPKKNQMKPHPNLNLTKKFYCIPTRIQFMGAFWKTRFPYCSSQPYGYFRYPLYIVGYARPQVFSKACETAVASSFKFPLVNWRKVPNNYSMGSMENLLVSTYLKRNSSLKYRMHATIDEV